MRIAVRLRLQHVPDIVVLLQILRLAAFFVHRAFKDACNPGGLT